MSQKATLILVAFASVSALPAATLAQRTGLGQRTGQAQAIASSDVLSQISMFNYREGPKSELYFRGTPVAANAEGEARVEYQNGNADISAEVKNLPEPGSLGPYTVHVLWALTPDGRATNQGVLTDSEGGKGKMQTQHGASQFALIVTAEPHFAVTAPSSMIVLYNVADDVEGEESKVTTLIERADYSKLERIAIDDDLSPPDLVQARYAVAIAEAAGADRFSSEAYSIANLKLAAAETALRGKRRSERKTASGLAREAVIAGEDARRAAMIDSAAAAAEAQSVAAARAATTSANEAAATAATAATAASELATEAERRRSDEAAATAARDDLLDRLSSALPTRQSDRGLVSEIGDAHFATGRADIDAAARESLARFSGIVASYPGLRFDVEGHTDSTGSVATNNALSLQRAIAARDYMIEQGVAASSIDVTGLGSSRPIADNTTADGRTANRRVEIVLSGGPLTAR